MATEAEIGLGMRFSIGTNAEPPVYTLVGELRDVTPPELTRDTIDATNHASEGRHREFISGLRDSGEVTAEVNFTPEGYDEMLAAYDEDGSLPFRIAMPADSSTKWDFRGVVTGLSAATPLDDIKVATMTIKVSGRPTFTV